MEARQFQVDELSVTIHFVSLRIIKEQFLKEAAPLNSKAGKWLEAWRLSVKAAGWANLSEVRETYPSADSVKVESGRSVTVFNVCGNDYRLLTSIHYDKQRIYTLQLLTHAEYDKNKWKKEL
jgi:mRNA interferase HigB